MKTKVISSSESELPDGEESRDFILTLLANEDHFFVIVPYRKEEDAKDEVRFKIASYQMSGKSVAHAMKAILESEALIN